MLNRKHVALCIIPIISERVMQSFAAEPPKHLVSMGPQPAANVEWKCRVGCRVVPLDINVEWEQHTYNHTPKAQYVNAHVRLCKRKLHAHQKNLRQTLCKSSAGYGGVLAPSLLILAPSFPSSSNFWKPKVRNLVTKVVRTSMPDFDNTK